MQLWESAELRFPVDLVIWHVVLYCSGLVPPPQKGMGGRAKKKCWLQNGWKVLHIFWPTSTSPLRWERQWTKHKLKWDCKHGSVCTGYVLKSRAREITTVKEIERFVGTKLEVPKRGCWFQKTPVVLRKTPEKKIKSKIWFISIVSSKMMLSLRDSTHLMWNNSGVIYMGRIIQTGENRVRIRGDSISMYMYIYI